MGELMKNPNALERPGLGRRLYCIAIIGLVLAGGLGIAINTVVPDVIGDELVFTSTPVPGTIGSTISLSASEASTDFVLFNDSSFSPESDWNIHYYEFNNFVSRFERQSDEIGTRFDISNIALHCSYETNINLRDYDTVTFSVDVTALTGPVEVLLNLNVESFFDSHYADYDANLTLTTGETGRLGLDLNVSVLHSIWGPLWLTQAIVILEIYPGTSNPYLWDRANLAASLRLENVSFTANSTVPLTPLVTDIQDTQGNSAYSPLAIINLIDSAAVNLTSEDYPNEWGILLPWRANDTIFVVAGNYSGIAGVYSFDYVNSTIPVSFEILADTSLHLGLQFEMVRVNLEVSPMVPYLRIIMWYDVGFWAEYTIEVAPPFPDTVCILKRSANLSISIATPPRVEWASRPFTNKIELEILQPTTIDIDLEVNLFSLGGILISAGEVLLIFLGLALLIGAVLSTQEPNSEFHWKQLIRDPRFWPVLLVGASILLPWFTSISSMQRYYWSSGGFFVVHRALYSPLACGLDSTANSMALVVFSRNFIPEVPSRIILFWLPLKWAAGHIGSPKKWSFNSYYGVSLLSPAFMGFLVLPFTPLRLMPALGYIVVCAAPILWVSELLIYRLVKRRKK